VNYYILPPRSTYSETDPDLPPETIVLGLNNVLQRRFFSLRCHVDDLSPPHDFTLKCCSILPADSTPVITVLYLHGSGGSIKDSFWDVLPLCKGYQGTIGLVCYDFPGSGNSDGDYVALGSREHKTIKFVVEHLVKKLKLKNIVLWGRSMGAVSAVLHLSNWKDDPYIENIKGVILDSPFSDLRELSLFLISKFKILSVIGEIALPLVKNAVMAKVPELDVEDFKVWKFAELIPDTIPFFMLHAEDDALVPPSQSKAVFDSLYGHESTHKEYHLVHGTHNSVRDTELIDLVSKFIYDLSSQNFSSVLRCKQHLTFIPYSLRKEIQCFVCKTLIVSHRPPPPSEKKDTEEEQEYQDLVSSSTLALQLFKLFVILPGKGLIELNPFVGTTAAEFSVPEFENFGCVEGKKVVYFTLNDGARHFYECEKAQQMSNFFNQIVHEFIEDRKADTTPEQIFANLKPAIVTICKQKIERNEPIMAYELRETFCTSLKDLLGENHTIESLRPKVEEIIREVVVELKGEEPSFQPQAVQKKSATANPQTKCLLS
jgi:pimeloyl-ACP methyl ester carboxylesterase